MPIYRDSGLDPVSTKIIRFLQKHPDKAFRSKEIAEKIDENPGAVNTCITDKLYPSKVGREFDGTYHYWFIRK